MTDYAIDHTSKVSYSSSTKVTMSVQYHSEDSTSFLQRINTKFEIEVWQIWEKLSHVERTFKFYETDLNFNLKPTVLLRQSTHMFLNYYANIIK